VGSALTITASASSIPGDVLYPVKLNWERVRLTLTGDDHLRQILEEELTGERLQELNTLIEKGRKARVQFIGILEEIKDTTWKVDGVVLEINEHTLIHGDADLGSKVIIKVEVQPDGSLVILEVTVLDDDEVVIETTKIIPISPEERGTIVADFRATLHALKTALPPVALPTDDVDVENWPTEWPVWTPGPEETFEVQPTWVETVRIPPGYTPPAGWEPTLTALPNVIETAFPNLPTPAWTNQITQLPGPPDGTPEPPDPPDPEIIETWFPNEIPGWPPAP